MDLGFWILAPYVAFLLVSANSRFRIVDFEALCSFFIVQTLWILVFGFLDFGALGSIISSCPNFGFGIILDLGFWFWVIR